MEWPNYTTKETLKDNDELMILDKDANANKRTLMDKIWDYVVDKMTTAVIAKLGTTNKTLIGAVNELNSNKFPINERYAYGKDINDLLTCGIYSTGGTLPSNSEMKNYPVDVTAHIIVITSTRIITQMFITHDLSYFYIRGKYNTHAFSSWKQVQISK